VKLANSDERVTSLDRILADQLAGRRITTGVVTTSGSLALALSAIGLYGLLAVGVADRRREFGIRVALGATPSDVAAGVVGQGLRWTAIGAAGGVGLALLAGPLVASLLVDVQPWDPVTLVVSTAVLFVAALAATLVPALRAAGVDPWLALRSRITRPTRRILPTPSARRSPISLRRLATKWVRRPYSPPKG
jgi:ABC-type antimicrobial peptide transport system permease subunit